MKKGNEESLMSVKWSLPVFLHWAGVQSGCIGTKELHFLWSLLQFFSGTVVSWAHSCNFPTASGHRQLSFFSKTSILTVFFSIEHMHLSLFLNRIRFFMSHWRTEVPSSPDLLSWPSNNSFSRHAGKSFHPECKEGTKEIPTCAVESWPVMTLFFFFF